MDRQDRIDGLGSVDGGFEMMDLLIDGWIIGSFDGGFGDDFF